MASSAIPAIANLGSGIIGGAGAIQQGQAQSASAGYNSYVASQNATLALANADLAGAIGEKDVFTQELRNRAESGGILANQGASGVDVNSGSSRQVRESAEQVGNLNALNIRAQAARNAYGYETEAAHERGQSELYRSEAASDKTAGNINAATTILGGVSKAAGFVPGSGTNLTPAARAYLTESGTASGLTTNKKNTLGFDFNV